MGDGELKVVVGSRNPVKVAAAQAAFTASFPTRKVLVEGVAAPSGVADQPMSEEETLLGARNRVAYCQAQHAADFYVGFEGGVQDFRFGPSTFAFLVISDGQTEHVGRSCNLPLPPLFYQQLESGKELGDVLDAHFNTQNVKQKGGAIGLLTKGLESRQSTYIQALTLALSPFRHPALYTFC
ncbi:non-canonical purine NTP phosphatase [Aliidiomarina taiwanensis]|uniref:Inosine/xanthosine triphosphatase n=1 Tax=Aliidiomarina taiwanensis TaxID=946228 RepID=A0A432X181_9GAMM|nr:inosine/xanthosine triphosphatase [Aliidiomarina taiwanensis]RUO40090.1 non-canonical purine NTP phosphatase [Aliidiomarina taiwanensis]